MKRMPPLNALKAFEVVAHLGGVQKASEEMCVTHGAVSRQIKQLESYLEVTLFDRSLRALTLTAAGKRYLKSISAAFDLIQEGTEQLSEYKSSNTLAIATTHSVASKWLMKKLPEFNELHPEIEVWLSLDQNLSNFDTGHLDLGLRIGKGPWPGLECTPLKNDQLIIVCSPHTDLRKLKDAKDITNYTLLHDQDPFTQWNRWFSEHGVEMCNMSKGPRYSSTDVLISAAMSGQGLALVSEMLAKADLDEKRLIQPLKNSVDLANYFWLVSPKNKPLDDKARLFIQWIKRVCLNE